MAQGESTATAQEQTPGSGNGSNVQGFQNQGGKTEVIQPSTQTPEGGSREGAGDGKPSGEGAEGTGNADEGAAGGEGEGADAYAPDTDGKFTHPETKTKVDAPEMVKYLAEKFGASTKGAQDLLTKNGTLTSEVEQHKGTIDKLTKDMEELRKVAEGKNPEGLNLLDLQARLQENTQELALVKENGALDAFEKTTPLAANKREALKALARANPKESLQKLWDANLKAGAEAEEAKRKADNDARKNGAGDKGKGTSTREPVGGGDTVKGPKGDTGLTQAEFDKLPVAERGRLLAQIGL